MLVGSLCLLFGFDVLVVCLVGCLLFGGYCDFGAFVFLLFCSDLFVGWVAGGRLLLSAFLLLLGVLFVIRCSLSFV